MTHGIDDALTDEIAKLRSAFLAAVPAAFDDHRFGEMMGSPWSVLQYVIEHFAEQEKFIMSDTYDSTQDTLDHIAKVEGYLSLIADYLRIRAAVHDQSKLQLPEKEIFDKVTPRLKTLTYGSDEYKAALSASFAACIVPQADSLTDALT
jgi:hypothetical protein